MRRIFGVLFMVLTFTAIVPAQDSLFTISGHLQYEKEGLLFLSLTSESQFMKNGVKPADFLILDAVPDSAGNRWVPFVMDSIPTGQYVISVFQDVNGNGKLDMGFMGPKEPFGFSVSRPRFIPKFENLNFDVQEDIENMVIEVK